MDHIAGRQSRPTSQRQRRRGSAPSPSPRARSRRRRPSRAGRWRRSRWRPRRTKRCRRRLPRSARGGVWSPHGAACRRVGRSRCAAGRCCTASPGTAGASASSPRSGGRAGSTSSRRRPTRPRPVGLGAAVDCATHVADLVETTDALGLEQPDWVGHSFGGRLILELAAASSGADPPRGAPRSRDPATPDIAELDAAAELDGAAYAGSSRPTSSRGVAAGRPRPRAHADVAEQVRDAPRTAPCAGDLHRRRWSRSTASSSTRRRRRDVLGDTDAPALLAGVRARPRRAPRRLRASATASSTCPACTWSCGMRSTRSPTRSSGFSPTRGCERRAPTRRARPRASPSRSRGRAPGSPRRRRGVGEPRLGDELHRQVRLAVGEAAPDRRAHAGSVSGSTTSRSRLTCRKAAPAACAIASRMHGSMPRRSMSVIVNTFASSPLSSSRSPWSSERTPTSESRPDSIAGSVQES